MAKTIYLVRHGEPEVGYTKRYLGRLDPGLSPQGVEQAKRIAAAIAPLAPARCLASPLRRAWDTALIIARACGLEVERNEQLMEIDFGLLEGKTFAEANALFPGVTDSWHMLASDFNFPEGENFSAFYQRAAAVAELAKAAPEDNILLVAHGGVLRGVLCSLLDLPANGPLRFRLSYASLTTVELGRDGAGVLTGFNMGRDFSPVYERFTR